MDRRSFMGLVAIVGLVALGRSVSDAVASLADNTGSLRFISVKSSPWEDYDELKHGPRDPSVEHIVSRTSSSWLFNRSDGAVDLTDALIRSVNHQARDYGPLVRVIVIREPEVAVLPQGGLVGRTTVRFIRSDGSFIPAE